MILESLLANNHFLFLIGTSDNDYNLFFLNQIPETLNSNSKLVSISPNAFIETSSFSNPLILIKDIDSNLEKLNYEEIQKFYEKCQTLRTEKKTKAIFFSKSTSLNFVHKHPLIKNLLNESLFFVPVPDAATQLSFFSNTPSKELKHHLTNFFEQHITPIFIIQLGSLIIDKFFSKNFSATDFQKFGGFEGLINIAGEKLKAALSTAGTQTALIEFFRPFLFINNYNHWSFVPQTKSSIIQISQASNFAVENFLTEACKLKLIKEAPNDCYEIASESLIKYWSPLKKWIHQEIALVNKYKELQKRALQYHNKEGTLLSAAQIDEVISWKASFSYSNYWGEQYAPETEIIWNFIDYSILINDANKEAETRKNRRLIRMTRAVAGVIGVAFILSFVAAIYAGIERKNAVIAQNNAEAERIKALQSKEEADLQRIKAEEASKAESLAKIAAEKDRQAALLASETAILEKMNALIAKTNAENEKEKAELAREDAEVARESAEKAREEALLAQRAEKEALAISLKNFENAEKLRLQQLASNMGLTASQFLRETKYDESLKTAVQAYQLNTANFGKVYEPAIAKALIEANTKFISSEFTFVKPIKSILLSEDGQSMACQFIDDELIDFDLESKRAHIIAANVKNIALGENNTLKIVNKNYQIFNYYFNCQTLEEQEYSAAQLLGIIPTSGILENDLFIRENGIYSSSGQLIIPFKTESLRAPFFQLNFERKTLLLKETFSLSLYRLKPPNTVEKIATLSLPKELKIMSFDLFAPTNKLIVGDVNGNIYSCDLSQASIKTLGNLHDSRISFLKVVNVLNTPLIISTSYDHTWKLTSIDFSNDQIGQSITFQAHSGWITSASYHESSNELFTAGIDKTLFSWQINLEKIVDKFNKI
jgi:hypothetical protein